jgi:hypothetical protein
MPPDDPVPEPDADEPPLDPVEPEETLPLPAEEPELPPDIALLSCTLPELSLQCVAAETFPELPDAPGELDDWPTAVSALPLRSKDASKVVFTQFI